MGRYWLTLEIIAGGITNAIDTSQSQFVEYEQVSIEYRRRKMETIDNIENVNHRSYRKYRKYRKYKKYRKYRKYRQYRKYIEHEMQQQTHIMMNQNTENNRVPAALQGIIALERDLC